MLSPRGVTPQSVGASLSSHRLKAGGKSGLPQGAEQVTDCASSWVSLPGFVLAKEATLWLVQRGINGVFRLIHFNLLFVRGECCSQQVCKEKRRIQDT